MLKNKQILITGGAGSIGSELVRQLATKNFVYILDIDETEMFDLVEELNVKGRVGDIRDKKVVEEVFEEYDFDIVFHVAALKHVTPNEFYPEEAVKTNVLGTYSVLTQARKHKCKLVNISTDKVVNAESIMGITKKLAEKMTKRMGYNSVRFGNVMGSRGSVLPIWQKQIDERKALTVTDSRMTRFMMTIPQAVELIIEASEMPQDGRIVVLDMGTPVNILDLAKSVLSASGHDIRIKEIGIRPGESLKEEIMSVEEKSKALKVGKFYVIR